MIRITTILVVLISIQCLGQKELDEVKIVDSIRYKIASSGVLYQWNKAEIDRMQADDIGSVLQRASGVSLKSYGGLGGMKTIAVRGLSGEHTTLVVDGFSISQQHIGQYDLSQIMAENVQRVSLVTGMATKQLLPVSSLISGNSVYIETFENSIGSERDALRVSSRIGSFRQLENYASYKRSAARSYFSCFGHHRYSLGNYAYTIQNGGQELNGIRSNNAYSAINGGASFGWVSKRGLWQGSFRSDDINQQLPGAIILYSDNSGQYLKTNNLRVNTSLTGEYKQLNYRFYAAALKGALRYTDSTFLNVAGVLEQQYHNDYLQLGSSFALKVKRQQFLFGSEQQLARLKGNMSFTGTPFRTHNFSFVSWKGELGTILTSISLNQQVVLSVQHDKPSAVYALKPIVQLEFPFSKGVSTSWGYLAYKSSLRMPTFYELYYNQIGNLNLLPEGADQIMAGVVFAKNRNRIEGRTRINTYRNYITNKIVAIPTKNLFTWSIQNIDNVIVNGFELIQELNLMLPADFVLSTQSNYSFQRALDVTDKSSPTYRDQIAYIPKHTANFDFNVEKKGNSLSVSVLTCSKRYYLNENIQINEIQGFTNIDIGLNKVVKRSAYTLKFGAMCKNVLGSEYAFVRNFVMPGRNYLLSISYAFN